MLDTVDRAAAVDYEPPRDSEGGHCRGRWLSDTDKDTRTA